MYSGSILTSSSVIGCKAFRPNLVGAPYMVPREPKADVLGVNLTSDTSISAADGSGRRSWLSTGERPGLVICVEYPKKPDAYDLDSLVLFWFPPRATG